MKEIKVSAEIYKKVEIICRAIRERRLLKFYYESESSGKKEWREIRPYMIIPNENEKLKVVGVPTEEFQIKFPEKRKKGHYLLSGLDMNRFEILDQTFNDPGVPPEIVIVTKAPPVCRFIYNHEDEKEIRKGFVKLVKE